MDNKRCLPNLHTDILTRALLQNGTHHTPTNQVIQYKKIQPYIKFTQYQTHNLSKNKTEMNTANAFPHNTNIDALPFCNMAINTAPHKFAAQLKIPQIKSTKIIAIPIHCNGNNTRVQVYLRIAPRHFYQKL